MNTFESIVAVITSEKFQDIEKHWNSFPLAECVAPANKLNKLTHGLYALHHPKYGIIYIGKGKPIFKCIVSHYKATQGIERAPAWKQFFSVINSDITVFWYEVNYPDSFVAEQCREALERLLQIKYRPLFDIMYAKGGHKEIPDFQKKLEGYLSNNIPNIYVR